LLNIFIIIIPNQYDNSSASFHEDGALSIFGKQNGAFSFMIVSAFGIYKFV